MKVLVIGAAGFVASHLLIELEAVKPGHDVFTLDCQPLPVSATPSRGYRLDITDRLQLSRAISGSGAGGGSQPLLL